MANVLRDNVELGTFCGADVNAMGELWCGKSIISGAGEEDMLGRKKGEMEFHFQNREHHSTIAFTSSSHQM